MDDNAEALKIAKNLMPIIEHTVRRMTENCVRSKLYTVSTAPNGSVIGVKDAFDSNEMLIPYSTALTNASVGDAVWCTWTSSNQSTMVAMWTGDVVSTTVVDEKMYTKLWVNPNVSANFVAQTVPLNLTGYDAVLVVYRIHTTSASTWFQFCDMGSMCCGAARGTSYIYHRDFTASPTGVTFSAGYRDNSSGANYSIPWYIFGIKGIPF